MSEPKVSVVVCTYNRAEMLRGALSSVASLVTDGEFTYEIVVVDNASTDHTGKVIEHFARQASVTVRGVYEPRLGVACARNRGIAEARGRWIAFFDDSHWLAELLAMARRTNARCVGGAVRLLLPATTAHNLSPVCRELLGESGGCDSPRRYNAKSAPGTGNLLIHRSVFERIGGFDESLREASEDSDLYFRAREAKIDAWYTPYAVVHHVIPSYRLRKDYLRWVSLRIGWSLVRTDQTRWGQGVFPLAVIGRGGQTLLKLLPKWLWARLRRAEADTLSACCLLWRAEGYARCLLHHLAPRLSCQEEFFNQLDFRSERGKLDQ